LSPSAEAARRSFTDTKKHYDPMTEGYGGPAEWRKQAERLAAGRGALRIPAAAEPARVPTARAADMAILGITAMPATADGLLAAYQARAEVLNDAISGDPDEFWRAFEAYERIMRACY